MRIVILTGDNDLVTRRICSQVSVSTDVMLLEAAIEAMDDATLDAAVEAPKVFAHTADVGIKDEILLVRMM